jgi:hypothetical protein
MGPPLYMWSIVNQNVVKQRMTVCGLWPNENCFFSLSLVLISETTVFSEMWVQKKSALSNHIHTYADWHLGWALAK